MEQQLKMTRKVAHLARIGSLAYNRSYFENWLEDYGWDKIQWLYANNHIEQTAPMPQYGERHQVYLQFTKKGKRWHDWYTMTLFEILKYKVFPIWRLRNAWQRLMIKLFNKHYAWQEYENVDLSNI